ncbi:MAG: hypothetical protein IJ685_08305 [Selenomonadaceae bacterium]|nr:hypothetical protein [Selenomonadaceae bacterium]
MIITEYNEEWDNDAMRAYYTEQAQLSMIKNLLAVKTPIEFIVKATGWSEEQILKLAQNDSEATALIITKYNEQWVEDAKRIYYTERRKNFEPCKS